jgi:hypothetical protein
MFYLYITIIKFLDKMHEGNSLWIGFYVYVLFTKLISRKIKMLIH